MFSAIGKRITYANVAMTLALVFAMSGGAYAAGKYLITSTKQISPKVLKSLVGKTGPAGANGANGANGAAGEKGAQGAQGTQGPEGKEGPGGKEGPAGTAGKEGKAGQTGFTETLPAGKTETGTWNVGPGPASTSHFLDLSFPIPLKEEEEPASGHVSPVIGESEIHYVEYGTSAQGCPGTPYKPEAEAGNLCIYEGTAVNTLTEKEIEFVRSFFPSRPGGEGASSTGTILDFYTLNASSSAWGTWAVTAPKEA